MSQDAVPYDEYWMDPLIKDIQEDDKVAGVYCRQIPKEGADFLTRSDINRHLTARKEKTINFIKDSKAYNSLTPKEKYNFCNFDNVCSCIRKDVWEMIPFRKTNFGEDIDWSKRILEVGYKIVYEPEAVVMHSHRRRPFYEYRRHYINCKILYEIFGLDSIPNFPYAMILFLSYVVNDMTYVLKNAKNFNDLFVFPCVPLFALFRVAGQYRGIQEAKRVLRYK